MTVSSTPGEGRRSREARGVGMALSDVLRSLSDTLMPEPSLVESVRVPLGVPSIDALLGGGVESGALTEFFGEAGSGKTNLCLQLAVNVAREGKKVLYIDTEGVSLERLSQIAGDDAKRVRQNVLFFEPFSLREQEAVGEKVIRLASSTPEVGLIVVDSATLHYRVGLGKGEEQRDRRSLAAQVSNLVGLARKRDLPVVITNQVYTNVDTDLLEPVGGNLLRHLSKAVIRLDKAGAGRRRATVVKHRSEAEGQSAFFILTGRGVESPDFIPPPPARVGEEPAYGGSSRDPLEQGLH